MAIKKPRDKPEPFHKNKNWKSKKLENDKETEGTMNQQALIIHSESLTKRERKKSLCESQNCEYLGFFWRSVYDMKRPLVLAYNYGHTPMDRRGLRIADETVGCKNLWYWWVGCDQNKK